MTYILKNKTKIRYKNTAKIILSIISICGKFYKQSYVSIPTKCK